MGGSDHFILERCKNNDGKMKEKEDADSRVIELEDQLRDYNKHIATPNIREVEIEAEHQIYEYSKTPSANQLEEQLRMSLDETNTKLIEMERKYKTTEAQLVEEREEHQGFEEQLQEERRKSEA